MTEKGNRCGVAGDAARTLDHTRRALGNSIGQLAAAIVSMNSETQAVAGRHIVLTRRTYGAARYRLSDSGSLHAGPELTRGKPQFEIESQRAGGVASLKQQHSHEAT